MCVVPTSVVTSGFYPGLEELCLTVSCCDLQQQRATHSSHHLLSSLVSPAESTAQ